MPDSAVGHGAFSPTEGGINIKHWGTPEPAMKCHFQVRTAWNSARPQTGNIGQKGLGVNACTTGLRTGSRSQLLWAQ